MGRVMPIVHQQAKRRVVQMKVRLQGRTLLKGCVGPASPLSSRFFSLEVVDIASFTRGVGEVLKNNRYIVQNNFCKYK